MDPEGKRTKTSRHKAAGINRMAHHVIDTAGYDSALRRELMPIEKDSINAQTLMAYFAMIAAWAGERDLALEHLANAVAKPGATLITSYGVLKLLPFWDPLRGDPRFEKIVASLAPK